MTHPLGIITSSVVAEGDQRRLDELDLWATHLVAGFALCGPEASMVHNIQPVPEGFALGMNSALRDLRSEGPLPEWILCINDDLHPDQKCIEELWKHRHALWVTCPTVDYTSCPEQAATGPSFEVPRRAAFVPAIAWLIPRDFVTRAIQVQGKDGDRGFLFDESLGRAWFEDDLVARVWVKNFDAQPFLIAPTAWAHHEGSRTSNAIPGPERHAARSKFEARVKELEL